MKTIVYLSAFFVLFIQVNLIAQVTVSGSTGANGNYTRLALAFNAINGSNQAGNNIIVKINASTTETSTASLTGAAGMWNTLTIYPTTPALSISGNFAGTIVDLNGADKVTIDGRVNQSGNKDLIIQHTSAADNNNSTIRFINSAENNIIQYCIVKGSCPGTSAGVILFSSSTAGNGNDNNLINYCDITNSGTRPVIAIMSDGGATGSITNSNNIISNNNFFNLINPGLTTHYDIYIYRLSTDFTVSGNSFFEENDLTITAASSIYNLRMNNSAGVITVAGNYFGGKSAQCGGGPLKINANNLSVSYYPLNITASTALISNITSNNVRNIDFSGTTALTPFNGIGATLKGNISENHIGDPVGNNLIKVSSALAVINMVPLTFGMLVTLPSIAGQNHPVYVLNNTIGAITTYHSGSNNHAHSLFALTISGGTAGGTCYIENNMIGSTSTANSILCSNSGSDPAGGVQQLFGITSSSAVTMYIRNNTIANLTNNKALNGTSGTRSQTIGISAYTATGNWEISTNTIHDLKCASANDLNASKASVIGIFHNASGTTQNIFGNTIYNLENTFSANSAVSVIAICFEGPTIASNSSIYGNFIHSLRINTANSSNTATVTGIALDNTTTAGDGTSVVRNVFNNIISIGNGVNNDCPLYGIFEYNPQPRSNNIYFNTVYLAGSPGGNSNTFAFFSDPSTTSTKNIRNNIFVNARSRISGTGKHYGAFFGNTTGLTVNYNNYFTPGTGGMLGFYNGVDVSSLPIVTGQDVNSKNINPFFVNSTGTIWYDYRATNNNLKNAGITIPGYSADFGGFNRPSPPSLGAIENDNLTSDKYSETAHTNKYELQQNYPNPFNRLTVIKFNLTQSTIVELNVSDMLGKVIAVLVNDCLSPGSYETAFDASGLAPGTYYYSLRSSNYFITKKMVLLK